MEQAHTAVVKTQTPTRLEALRVGDLIYADVIINIDDMADPTSTSTTAKKIKGGKAVRRICIVLVAGSAKVQVTYISSLGGKDTLPATLKKTMWYPFAPATKEGTFEPLPRILTNAKAMAGWASLRTMHTVTESPVEKLDGQSIPEKSANAIRASIHS